MPAPGGASAGQSAHGCPSSRPPRRAPYRAGSSLLRDRALARL